MARPRTTLPKPAPAIAWRDTLANVVRLIDANPLLVPEALEVLFGSDAKGVPVLVVKGSGSLEAFSDLIVDVDAFDPKADPMDGWTKEDFDLVYDQIAFMSAQRDALHTCATVRALRASGCFPEAV